MVKTSVYIANSAADIAAAEAWLGRDLDAVHITIGFSSWSDWLNSQNWQATQVLKGTNVDVLWSLGLIPNGASLDVAAAGGYNDKYLAMAKQFVANSGNDAQIYIRLGWEMNTNGWFPWSTTTKTDAYVGAFRQLVDTFRSVSDKFVFEWTPNVGDQGVNPELMYPGDAYVDVIGMDFYYDTTWDSKNANVAFNYFVSEKYGLQWHQNFAAAHGKPTAYSEWGLNSDNPTYVQLAEKWFEDHNVLYQSYWNSNAAFTGKLSDGQFPNAAAAFKAAFGSDAYTGAVVVPTQDVFTSVTNYVIPDDVLHLTFTGTGAATIVGNVLNNIVTGGAGNDFINLSQGGIDQAFGGAGNDGIFLGKTLTADDIIDGGDGADDQLGLQGNYALTFGAKNLLNIETLALLSGADTRFGDTAGNLYSYTLTTIDANVAKDAQLTVNFTGLRAGENVSFNGAAETDGSFIFYAGNGIDTLIGGARNDGFFFAGSRFSAADRIDGGGGADNQVAILGDYSAGLTLAATTLKNIQTLALLSSNDTRGASGTTSAHYEIIGNDANVDAGQMMTVSATGLRADEWVHFNGSAETNGYFRFIGGAGNDVFVGGKGNDIFYGGGGADKMTGGAGNDTYIYGKISESTPGARDTITDVAAGDKIDLSRIDAIEGTPANDAFTFIGSGAFTGHAGELHIVGGNGVWAIEGDTNGDGVADFAIGVNSAVNYTLTIDSIVA